MADEPYTGPRRFWFTMPRGHDKTSFIGRLISWVLSYSRRELRAVAAAADRDQASFLTQFMQAEANLNPWLKPKLTFKVHAVAGVETGCALRILSADEFSSYGLKEDLIILDELTHWADDGLWNSIVSGLDKRKSAVIVVISNAGLKKTWQHHYYELAKKSKYWYVYQAPGCIASWIDKDTLADSRKMLPTSLARRVYDNVWLDPGEESGFLTPAEAAGCIDPQLSYQVEGKGENAPYYAAVDYGSVKDRTVLCVGHQDDDTGMVILDRMDVLQGSPEHRVQIKDVEEWIEEQRKGFPGLSLVIDPHQMESTIQHYEPIMTVERFEPRAGKANYQLAANLRALIIAKKLAFYPSAGELIVDGELHGLAEELSEVIIRPMSYGFRIDHERTSYDDRVIALGMLALRIIRQEGVRDLIWNDRYF